MERGAQRGASRGRPHSASMACSCASSACTGSAVSKPATRLMKSAPSKPTARLRYQREKRAPGKARASSATARATLLSASTLLPAATYTRGTSAPGCRAGEVGARALDDHADVARAADGARLVDHDAHPRNGEFGENHQRQAVRERLDQLELGGLDEGQRALGDLLVVERVGHQVGACGVAAVDRQLDVEHHGLLDAPLPVDEADDALGGQAVQEDAVA